MNGKKILIVEDEPNIADALSFLLSHEGFEVTVESDGALALVREHYTLAS